MLIAWLVVLIYLCVYLFGVFVAARLCRLLVLPIEWCHRHDAFGYLFHAPKSSFPVLERHVYYT